MNCPFCQQPADIRIVSYGCNPCNILIRVDENDADKPIQTIIFPLLDSPLRAKFIQLSIYYKTKGAILSGRSHGLTTIIPFEFAQTITPTNIVQKLQTYLVFS